MWMSLSMVLGMPTTLIFSPLPFTDWAIRVAALRVPSPPIMNRMPMFIRSRQSTMASMSWGPRDEPRIVPPMSRMSATVSGVEFHDVMTVFGDESLQAVADAVDVAHPVVIVELQDNRPDDVVEPRAQTAAGHQRAAQLARVEVDFVPGAGHFQGRGGRLDDPSRRRPVRDDVDQHALVVGDKVGWTPFSMSCRWARNLSLHRGPECDG